MTFKGVIMKNKKVIASVLVGLLILILFYKITSFITFVLIPLAVLGVVFLIVKRTKTYKLYTANITKFLRKMKIKK